MSKELLDILSNKSQPFVENYQEVHKEELQTVEMYLSEVYEAITNKKPINKILDAISKELQDAFGVAYTVKNTTADVANIMLPRIGNVTLSDISAKEEYEAVTKLIKNLNPRQLSENRTFKDLDNPAEIIKRAMLTRKNENLVVSLMLSERAKALKAVTSKEFSIDRKRVYITGGEDISITISVNFKRLFIDEGFMEREVLSVILHEVGHGMTQLDNLVSIAQVDAGMVDVLEVGSEILRGVDVKERLKGMKDVLYNIYRDDMSQHLSKEYMSDDFVVKLGYEHEFKTVLDFIERNQPDILKPMNNNEILPLLGLAISAIVFMGVVVDVSIAFMFLLYITAMTLMLKQGRDTVYGTPKDRLENLRNSIISKIRNRTRKLTRAEKDRYNILLNEIDLLLKEETKTNFLRDIADHYDGQKINYDINKSVKRLINNRLHI